MSQLTSLTYSHFSTAMASFSPPRSVSPSRMTYFAFLNSMRGLWRSFRSTKPSRAVYRIQPSGEPDSVIVRCPLKLPSSSTTVLAMATWLLHVVKSARAKTSPSPAISSNSYVVSSARLTMLPRYMPSSAK